jgi:hypothetical protein
VTKAAHDLALGSQNDAAFACAYSVERISHLKPFDPEQALVASIVAGWSDRL